MSALSRRTLVTSAAALPALSVPALADNPDAELVRLAEQFEDYQSSHNALLADYNEKAEAANKLAFDRMEAINATNPPLTERERDRQFWTEMNRAWAETGADEADRKLATVTNIDAIMRKIVDTPCHTVAGLRAKALVALDISDKLWRETKRDLDWDKEVIRALIESVCVVTGLEIPAERLPEDEAEVEA